MYEPKNLMENVIHIFLLDSPSFFGYVVGVGVVDSPSVYLHHMQQVIHKNLQFCPTQDMSSFQISDLKVVRIQHNV